MAASRSRSPGIRARLFLLSIALIAVALLGATVYISRGLDRDLGQRAQAELRADAELVAVAVRGARAFESPQAMPLVRSLAQAANARVTIIDDSGRVIADSAVPGERLALVENHRDRPEVRAALAHGVGSDRRQSSTTGVSLVYLAVRFDGPTGTPWIARVAEAPALLEAASGSTRRTAILGALLGLVTAAMLSYFAAQMLARPLAELTATARAMVQDLKVRSRLRTDDELGALAGALDELADGLANSLANLESERDRLEAILEAMAEGVLVTNAEGRIVLANRALRETLLLGRDVMGRTPIEAIRNVELHELIERTSQTREAVTHEVSVEGVRPRRLMVRATPVASDDAGVVAVLTDVTELRRLETVRRDFVANVSHELRTPIAAVRAAVETLKDGALAHPAAAQEFLSIIDRHGERLHQLVEDLLELSRIEAKELKLKLEGLDPGEAIGQSLELLRIAASKKSTRIVTDVDPAVPTALGDRRALGHVLNNLIDNAIKYSPEGATVTVRAREHQGRVRFEVPDTGMGIDARHLPRVFERFYRVDPGRSRQLGGTGLGLAIVKHLTEAMGGSVGVTSEVGRGSVFFAELPVDDTEADDAEASNTAGAAA